MRRRKVLVGAVAAIAAAVVPVKAEAIYASDVTGGSWTNLEHAAVKIGRHRYRWADGAWRKILSTGADTQHPHWSEIAKTPFEIELRMPAGGPIDRNALKAARRVARINRKVKVRTTVTVLKGVDIEAAIQAASALRSKGGPLLNQEKRRVSDAKA